MADENDWDAIAANRNKFSLGNIALLILHAVAGACLIVAVFLFVSAGNADLATFDSVKFFVGWATVGLGVIAELLTFTVYAIRYELRGSSR